MNRTRQTCPGQTRIAINFAGRSKADAGDVAAGESGQHGASSGWQVLFARGRISGSGKIREARAKLQCARTVIALGGGAAIR